MAPLEVQVTIRSAKHLKNVNWRHGDLKPYAVVWVDPSAKCSTPADDCNDTDPVWDEKLTIPVRDRRVEESTLCVDIVHADAADDTKPLVGSARLPLSEVVDEVGLGRACPRTLKLKRPSGRPQGKLDVEVEVREYGYYQPPAASYAPPYSQTSRDYAPPYSQSSRDYAYAPPYGAPPPYAAPPPSGYPYSPYGQAPYAQQPYGQPAYAQEAYAQPPAQEKKGSKFGMGTGLAVGAAAGLLGGLAIAEGVDYVEDKITDNVAEKVEDDLGYDDGGDFGGDDF